MSLENELKMIPREELNPQDLLELLNARGYNVLKELKTKVQEDTYYDDFNKTLENAGCSFRIRRKGEKAVVTYKSPVKSDATYKQREEMEVNIPEIYIQEDGRILVEDAIDILRKEYPDIEFPENLEGVVKVVNNRNKTEIQANDGTIIELAFDDLYIEDGNAIPFEMKNEIECEVINGNPQNLEELYKIIDQNYDINRNELSKYSRAVKEMNEQRENMSLDEIAICAMLSDIIKSKEFEQLAYKGQMIHDYRIHIPENLNLDNFKNPQYLIEKISEIKRTKNYKPGKIRTLEDMFLCFFSDMDYQDVEYKLANFLNENYYKEGTPITNRMLHSQQVMLITGLISKSKEISSNERKPLLCMVSALLHDIGHVPGAHPTEEILGTLDGFFSHEINGKNVVEKIVTKDEENIIKTIKDYYSSLGRTYTDEECREYIERNKTQIKKSIEAHSRTNSEKRGEGTVVQIPREADKICYCVSDIVDIIKRTGNQENSKTVQFFSDDWKEYMKRKLGKGYEEKEEIIRQKVEEIEKLINTNNFGVITTNIANTVHEHMMDGRIYYDVEQDTWDIVNGMIKCVKDLRSSGVVDNKREQLQYAAAYFAIRKFNENLAKTSENVEMAWDKTLEEITQSNDLDILNCIYDIKEKYKSDPDSLTEAYQEGGMLDYSKLNLLDNSDRQIKMQPRDIFQVSDLLPYLGQQYTMPQPEKIIDTYYKKQNGLSICLRINVETLEQQLIVKRKRDKDGVTQVEREKYVSKSFEKTSLEDMIKKFNTEHPDFNIQIPNEDAECVIMTVRSNTENEHGVVIRKDKSTIITGEQKIVMPETIEIECHDRNVIKKVKQHLNEFLDMQETDLRAVSTKETKEEQALRLIKEQKNKGEAR